MPASASPAIWLSSERVSSLKGSSGSFFASLSKPIQSGPMKRDDFSESGRVAYCERWLKSTSARFSDSHLLIPGGPSGEAVPTTRIFRNW